MDRYYRQQEENLKNSLKRQIKPEQWAFWSLLKWRSVSFFRKRDKESLHKQELIKQLLKRQPAHQEICRTLKQLYICVTKWPTDTKVEKFYEKESIDLPGKCTVSKVSMTQKKVLRKSRTHLKSSNRKILCTDFLWQLLHADDQNSHAVQQPSLPTVSLRGLHKSHAESWKAEPLFVCEN